MMILSQQTQGNGRLPLIVQAIYIVGLFSSSASLFAAPAEFHLVTLSGSSGVDTSTSLPAMETGFDVGTNFFLEAWVQTTDLSGLSSASLDLNFDPALATAVAITHSSVFSELIHGTIDNMDGTIDDLSGSHLGSCDDAVGVAPNWTRLAVVEFTVGAAGQLAIAATPTQSAVYGTAICGVGDIDAGDITFDSITVATGGAEIPAVSTWGVAITWLLLMIAGTLVINRGFLRNEVGSGESLYSE